MRKAIASPKFASESEMARPVIDWLETNQWDVYQEVQPDCFGRTADIVARQGRLVWVVECKLTFGLDVIEQAFRWRHDAHFVSIAIPTSRRSSEVGIRICGQHGIGVFRVKPEHAIGGMSGYVRNEYAPALNRHAKTHSIVACLNDKHKTFAAAGNAQGRRWTPFQQTCSEVRRVVKEQPGISMTELVRAIKTHYSSDVTARACLRKWIEAEKVRGVRAEIEGRRIQLFPTEVADVRNVAP